MLEVRARTWPVQLLPDPKPAWPPQLYTCRPLSTLVWAFGHLGTLRVLSYINQLSITSFTNSWSYTTDIQIFATLSFIICPIRPLWNGCTAIWYSSMLYLLCTTYMLLTALYNGDNINVMCQHSCANLMFQWSHMTPKSMILKLSKIQIKQRSICQLCKTKNECFTFVQWKNCLLLTNRPIILWNSSFWSHTYSQRVLRIISFDDRWNGTWKYSNHCTHKHSLDT